jgi:hypothetical protein
MGINNFGKAPVAGGQETYTIVITVGMNVM